MRPAMVLLIFSLGLTFGLGGLPTQVRGEEVAIQEAALDAASLVKQLGDPSYARRERARLELLRREAGGFEALQAGLKSDDLEIQYHCERLLVEIREREIARQLADFVNEQDKTRDYDFPGWPALRALADDEQHLRQLYVDMYRAEPELLSSMAESQEALIPRLTNRATQLQLLRSNRGDQTISMGSIAALLLAAGQDNLKLPANGNSLVYQLCYQPTFREGIDNAERGPVLRKLLGRFMDNTDDNSLLQGLTLSTKFNMPTEGLKLAERSLGGAGPPHIRQYAILTIAKLGNAEHVELVSKLLQDQTVCGTQQVNKVRYQTQLRDVALFATIHLAKQDPKEFGFERMTPNPQLVVNVQTLGFVNDEQRQTAIEKWQQFVADEKAKSAPAEKK